MQTDTHLLILSIDEQYYTSSIHLQELSNYIGAAKLQYDTLDIGVSDHTCIFHLSLSYTSYEVLHRMINIAAIDKLIPFVVDIVLIGTSYIFDL